MLQSVSHYMMPGDDVGELSRTLTRLGLDGIENLVYGETPPRPSGRAITIGCHLAYWPIWMNFYLGRKELLREDFPTDEDVIRNFGGLTVENWLARIRGNIKAALAEHPRYLVWHVADCRNSDIWTRDFLYTNREILKCAAEVYSAVADAVPENVLVLFENIFWPGLYQLDAGEVEYFFSRLPGHNVGLMLDTGHLMNTDRDLTTEAEGAAYVCGRVKQLGSLAHLIRGIHLSCSLSGAYQKSAPATPPENYTPQDIRSHILSIDQHRPFLTDAAKRIVDTVQPDFLTHEIFGHTSAAIPEEEVRAQMKAVKGAGEDV